MKYLITLVAAIVVAGLALAQQAERPSVLKRYSEGLSYILENNWDEATVSFEFVIEEAVTPAYRVSGLTGLAATHVGNGLNQAAIDAADEALSGPDAQDPDVQPILVRALAYKADALRELGLRDQAIQLREVGISQWSGVVHADDLSRLYLANAKDEVDRGDFAAATVWYDRLFDELPEHGFDHEDREFHRMQALQNSGFGPEDQQYRARALELASDPDLESGRASACLLSEAYYSAVLAKDRSGRRAIAEQCYSDSLLYGWHLSPEFLENPSLLSPALTGICREAVLFVMLDATALEPRTSQELDENYLYAKLVVDHMSDMDASRPHLGRLMQLIRRYELQIGIGG